MKSYQRLYVRTLRALTWTTIVSVVMVVTPRAFAFAPAWGFLQ